MYSNNSVSARPFSSALTTRLIFLLQNAALNTSDSVKETPLKSAVLALFSQFLRATENPQFRYNVGSRSDSRRLRIGLYRRARIETVL